jgi:RNA polymerase sigma factor (sigma-70 family)
VIRVPSPVLDQQRKLKQVERQLRLTRSSEPTELMLAEAVAQSPEEIDDLRRSLTAEVSCEAPVGGSEALTVGETLAESEPEDVTGSFDRAALRRAFRSLMPVLPERERSVIEWRYGLRDGKPRTLAEIGKKIGVSRERVRQIEKQALACLRENVDAQELAMEMGLH